LYEENKIQSDRYSIIACNSNQINKENTTPEDTGALFGGVPENGYPFAGFMLTEKPDGDVALCGINIVSKTKGVSAAHCLEDGFSTIYPVLGEYRRTFKRDAIDFSNASMSPDYGGMISVKDAGIHDVSVIEFGEEVNLSEYAQIAAPKIGCDYYIVGYGTNEQGLLVQRMGGDVCIKTIEDARFEIERSSTFFCGGDSGSGIYEKDTNNLVGVVSAYSPAGDCKSATRFFAGRVDVEAEFIFSGESGRTDPLVLDESIVDEDDSIAKINPFDTEKGQTIGDLTQDQIELVTAVFLFVSVIATIASAFLIFLYIVARIFKR
jgi:V8-like Glu-specific endopeptidase